MMLRKVFVVGVALMMMQLWAGAAFAGLVSYDFAADPNWTSMDTSGTNMDFGYSGSTNYAVGSPPSGEIGGTMSRQSSGAHYYGKDVSAASLDLSKAFEVSWTSANAANFYYDNLGSSDNDAHSLGYFNAESVAGGWTVANFVGFLQVDNVMKLYVKINGGDESADLGTLASGSTHTLRLKYDPLGGSYGQLSGSMDGGAAVTLNLTQAAREAGNSVSLDTFGLWAYGYSGWTAGDGSNMVFYDNLAISEIPEPSALVMLAFGLAGLMAYAWRRQK